MILQSNPQLWSVAGDLFIKNMDWPGAQEMAERFKKILDPKVLAGGDKSPELVQAEHMVEALTQELNQMHTLITHVKDSAEMQKIQIDEYEAQIKAFDAETKRITAVSANMTPEQIQDIVLGTLHAAMQTGDLTPPAPPQTPQDAPEAAPAPPEGAAAPQAPEQPPQAAPPPDQPPEGPQQ